MIFRSVKIIFFAFFTLALSAGNAACACCLPIDAGHTESAHDDRSPNEMGHRAHQKMGAAMPSGHSSHGDDKNQQPGACVDDCHDGAFVAVVETTALGDRLVERLPQPAEENVAANSGGAGKPDRFSGKRFAVRHWRAPPRQTPINLKIRLMR